MLDFFFAISLGDDLRGSGLQERRTKIDLRAMKIFPLFTRDYMTGEYTDKNINCFGYLYKFLVQRQTRICR